MRMNNLLYEERKRHLLQFLRPARAECARCDAGFSSSCPGRGRSTFLVMLSVVFQTRHRHPVQLGRLATAVMTETLQPASGIKDPRKLLVADVSFGYRGELLYQGLGRDVQAGDRRLSNSDLAFLIVMIKTQQILLPRKITTSGLNIDAYGPLTRRKICHMDKK